MKVRVRYFASIREAMGCTDEVLETGAATLGALRLELAQRAGAAGTALAPQRAVRMALNQVLQPESAALSPDCEVAFFPPVTGG